MRQQCLEQRSRALPVLGPTGLDQGDALRQRTQATGQHAVGERLIFSG